jgi:maleylpyruvate isomerase
VTAPATVQPTVQAELALLRGGTAYFLRQLSVTSDAALAAPSALPGWTAAEIVADVAYQARGLTACIEGFDAAIDLSPFDRAARVLFGATLSPVALRHLAYHTAVHLNVALRDVVEAGVHAGAIAVVPGEPIELDQAMQLRTQTLWLRSLDLGGLATLRDAPDVVPRRLIEGLQPWAWRSDVRVIASDSRRPHEVLVTIGPDGAAHDVRGSLARLGRWAAGRAPGAFEIAAPPRAADIAPTTLALRSSPTNGFAAA